MVQALHNAGISVVMDVVYGHVARSDSFSINMLTPSYYSRTNSNGSGCGNDTATERAMNRKYIVDSMVYWATEYHIDGFRIDQAGLFDVDTINEISEALHEINPTIILYGEGWTMLTNISKDIALATQENAELTPEFGYFSDGFRDSVKGGVFIKAETGYVTGNFAWTERLNYHIQGNAFSWSAEPYQMINYNSCHDNYTLFDKISISAQDYSEEERIRANNLAAAILFTSQGVPFMQAGEELLRTKQDEEGNYINNSYASESSINSIKWNDLNKEDMKQTYEYYRGLIEFRKSHSALRMTTSSEISENFHLIQDGVSDEDGVIVYSLNGDANSEISEDIIVIYNPSKNIKTVTLPEGEWKICVNAEKAGNTVLGKATETVDVEPISAMILVKGQVREEQKELISSTDSAFSIVDINEVISTGLKFIVKKIEQSFDEIGNILSENEIAYEEFIGYDLYLSDQDDTRIDSLNEKMQVKFNIPFSLKENETIKIYRIKNSNVYSMDSNILEEYEVSVEDDKVVFETDNLGVFCIVKTKVSPDRIVGDVNGDGTLDIKDSALLKRYLAGWEVEIDEEAADVDGDGKVTIKDSALVKRYLAGWDVEFVAD